MQCSSQSIRNPAGIEIVVDSIVVAAAAAKLGGGGELF